MKKILSILFILIAISSYSQSDTKLIKKDGKFKVEYKGKEFDANERILTIKPKDQADLPKNLEFIHKNKLGFIDVKIPKGRNIEEYADELLEMGLFEVVEFNAYGEYHSFNSNDTDIASQLYLSTLNMFDAWELSTGCSSIVVGILDSGIDWEHEDIGIGTDSYQNIFLNPGDAWSDSNDPTTGNGFDDDGNGLIDDWKGWNYSNNTNDSRPVVYHGTFVSGIISAKTNNNKGIAGIVGGNNNTGVRLLSYHLGNVPDGSILDDAIIDAVDVGVRVIQLSLSISSSSAINSAIQYAVNNDVLVICCSMNDNSSVAYPASNSNVMAVGAITASNTRASFSNYGTELDVVAPGVDIYSTTLNDNYTTGSGTSFAAPQVSAIAALLFSIDNSLSALEVRNIIESTTQKVGGYSYITTSGHPNGTWNDQMGYGLVNAYAAVMAVCPTISGPSIICSSGATFTINNPPDWVSISWAKSNNLQITNGQGTMQITVNRISGGNATISSTITTSCGIMALTQAFNSFVSLSKEYDYFNCNDNIFTATAPPETSIIWETTNGLLINGMSSPQSGIGNTVTISSPYGTAGEVTASNCYEYIC